MNRYEITVRTPGAFHNWTAIAPSFCAAFMGAWDRFAGQGVSIKVRPC